MRRSPTRIELALLALTASTTGALAQAALEPIRYGRDVRPILSDRCFQCHGADDGTREADLRLDLRKSAVDETEVIVPGAADDSELWLRITSDDVGDVMPPPDANKRPLSAAELAVLRRWIQQGAEYEPHWAFAPPIRVEPPRSDDPYWSAEPIDRFVRAKLRTHGVTPSVPADPATLLRRVFLDLTGLPPTVSELNAFRTAASAGPTAFDDAYVDVVDRIMTTEPYRSRLAEHLAVSWLDAARYGDTIGIHTDNGKQMWPWRDWVLRALRDNMPYDRFVLEQLAGDLIPEATVQQRIASGFHRNHVMTDEGGALSEEYLFEYAVDRVDTTATVLLGLTMGCARCHDHKFDPITQADYYGLLGFFNSVDEPGLYSQTQDANRAYEPFLEVPSREQRAELERIDARHAAVLDQLARPLTGEAESFESFVGDAERGGVSWSRLLPVRVRSSDDRVNLSIDPDGGVRAAGPVPDFEDYTFEFLADGSTRLLLVDAVATPPGPNSDIPPGAGRAAHGNVVLTHVGIDSRSAGSDDDFVSIPLHWAWADHSQQNLDYEVGLALVDDAAGWAADGNAQAGPRTLMFLTDRPLGDGTVELRVTLAFRSRFPQHQFAHVRFYASPLDVTNRLPVHLGRWYRAGPFRLPETADRSELLYATEFGPEAATDLDLDARFGDQAALWTFDSSLVDDEVVSLPGGAGTTYLGRTLWSPDAREVECAFGTDDGYSLFLNGERIQGRRVDRAVARDQERATLPLRAGRNLLVLEVVNTGGPSGYAFRLVESDDVLTGELVAAVAPREAVHERQQAELREAWRREFFDEYRRLDDERVALETARSALERELPKAMVMRELAAPRPSFVMHRGQYDAPDESRPAGRRTPSVLPPLPDGAPNNRLGFALWLTAPGHPLFARVAVNRFWQQIFGAGLVRTPADFGLQGEWPTHPELLDTLAVDFRESGFDVRALLRRIVLSRTYRQSSVHREELAAIDPDDRLHARYPRRRLSAEQIRDHALHASGLLVERFGGPSVRPYQPDGLWREVAMPASNTRHFTPDDGEDLWRRSVYTYWKRASPPPSLLTFDAPTRESCVVARPRTNTPLQALVLWNDVQFVEAARRLAARLCEHHASDDRARVVLAFEIVAGRVPDDTDVSVVLDALDVNRTRFHAAPDAAAALLAHGASERGAEDVIDAELAAWTLACSALFNLHETVTQD